MVIESEIHSRMVYLSNANEMMPAQRRPFEPPTSAVEVVLDSIALESSISLEANRFIEGYHFCQTASNLMWLQDGARSIMMMTVTLTDAYQRATLQYARGTTSASKNHQPSSTSTSSASSNHSKSMTVQKRLGQWTTQISTASRGPTMSPSQTPLLVVLVKPPGTTIEEESRPRTGNKRHMR